MTSQTLVDVADAHYRWPGRNAFGMTVARLTVARGERLLLVGPSGTGKSTLLSLIAGIVAPDAGRIAVLDRDLAGMSPGARDRYRAEHMGVVFQLFNLLPYASAIDNILLSLSFAPDRRSRVGPAPAQVAEARRLLEQLGLDPHTTGTKQASTLSVGQQQRVAAARALIGAPELVIADEPTSALDTEVRDQFLHLLFAELGRAGAGLVMVSHDAALGPRFDRVVGLADIVTTGTPNQRAASGTGGAP